MLMFKSVKKMFDISEKEIKKSMKIVKKINDLEEKMIALPDGGLKAKTKEFKERIGNGESLESIMPEAYAVVREASKRVLGMRHYDVQLVGGIVLHSGNIAEMRTGEGKTLVSTLPVYLNALTGKGVHVITVNDYLAQRDATEMGELHKFLGLTVGINVGGLGQAEKREVYQCDITYGTNNEFGFDYLRDNMVLYAEDKVQRGMVFAIIDEVDSVLIDEARTPLIISGNAEKSTALYKKAQLVVKTMKENVHYKYDVKTKSVTLTEDGVSKVEKSYGIKNLFDISNVTINHHVKQALRANVVMKKDFDYVVTEGQVIIVDQFTGRMMAGRRFSEGLHQAIEAKEGVDIQNESMTLATITFQNYFRMYEKLSGMTGTAKTEASEFKEIYKMKVISIPTNLPIARVDKVDSIYKSDSEKYEAIVKEIEATHKTGQPILVGTANIETSELLSEKLSKVGVPHYVLNAKQHDKEAEIIAQAGHKDSVTIATNMAGRGTDIKLGEGVVELGGLKVVGTERHESRRIDNQLRGRAGRQGDPGESLFYLSLEDDLMKRFGRDNLKNMMDRLGVPNGQSIESKMVSRSIESAQKRVEGNNFDSRKWVLKFDDVLREQREIIYKQRDEILTLDSLKEFVLGMVRSNIEYAIQVNTEGGDIEEHWNYEGLIEYLNARIFEKDEVKKDDVWLMSKKELLKFFMDKVEVKYLEKEKLFGDGIREFEKVILLRTIDSKWMTHIDAMHKLRQGIHLRSYAQTDPLRDYQFEGFEMFESMMKSIEEDVATLVMKAQLEENTERVRVIKEEPKVPQKPKANLKIKKRK
jgi:preprotein translocase subunit SecA